MFLIGLSGKKQTGKTTIAHIIEDLLPENTVVQLAFAQALKVEVANATGQSLEFIEDHKEYFRLILQGWGTDYKRKLFGEDYWVKKILQALSIMPQHIKVAIISDVRFKNEAEIFSNTNGLLFRVKRGFSMEDSQDYHISEGELDSYIDFDDYIENNGSLEELKLRVHEVLVKHGVIKLNKQV